MAGLVWAAPPAAAQSADEAETAAAVASDSADPRPATAEAAQRVRYPLTAPLLLNGVFLGDINAEVDLAGDGAVERRRLLDLLEGVVSDDTFEQIEERAGQEETTPFEALNFEGFRIGFDSATLEVKALIPNADLEAQGVSVAGAIDAPNPKAFDQAEPFAIGANISVSQAYDYDDGRLPFDATVLGFANVLGFEGFVLGGGFNVTENVDSEGDDPRFEFERRDVEISKDFYESAIRVSAGEIDPLLSGFQDGVSLAGVSVSRRFGVIRPFENLQPSGRGEIVLERPSTVDVEVNGVLVETIALPAGRFTLQDFPFATGANDVRLVVEDETGRREIARLSLFNDADLLEPGMIDFSAAVGVPREGGIDTYETDNPVGTGFFRIGATNWLTVGGTAQASVEIGQIGLEASFGTPIGLFNVENAYSWDADHGETGFAAAVDYQESFSLLDEEDLRFTGTVAFETEDFSGLTEGETFNGRELDAVGRLNFRLPIGVSLGLSGGYTTFRSEEDPSATAGLSVGTTLGPVGVSLSGNMERQDGDADFNGFVGLSYRFGERYSARARYSSVDNRSEVEVARSPRSELHDISGRVRVSREDETDVDAVAELRYFGNRTEAEFDHNLLVTDGIDGETSQVSQFRATSGIGFAGGKLAIGRPFTAGFIIASRHETLSDSDLALTSATGGRVEAESDLLGPPLVPIDRPYGAKRLAVEVSPLPLGYDIGAGVIDVFPGAGAGYAFTIGSDASRTVIGFLNGPDGAPVSLAVGVLTADSGDEALNRQFFTNQSGRFVADKVAPGAYTLVLNGAAIGAITVPDDGDPLVDVGVIVIPEDDNG